VRDGVRDTLAVPGGARVVTLEPLKEQGDLLGAATGCQADGFSRLTTRSQVPEDALRRSACSLGGASDRLPPLASGMNVRQSRGR